ncbi:MAG TPA: hypothetical protein VGM44_21410, partial [Polyangiaceae bacterium]
MRFWVRWGLAALPLFVAAMWASGCSNSCLNPQPDLPCGSSDSAIGTPSGGMGGSSNIGSSGGGTLAVGGSSSSGGAGINTGAGSSSGGASNGTAGTTSTAGM